MPYRVTQCYLPPNRGENPAFTPSRSRYSIYRPRRDARLSWPMLRESHRPGIEPATGKSQVQRPTAEPPRNKCVDVSAVSFVEFWMKTKNILFVYYFVRCSLFSVFIETLSRKTSSSLNLASLNSATLASLDSSVIIHSVFALCE